MVGNGEANVRNRRRRPPLGWVWGIVLALSITSAPAVAQVAQQDGWEALSIGGVQAFHRGEFAAAAELFAEALALARGFEPSDERLIISHANLGLAYSQLQRLTRRSPSTNKRSDCRRRLGGPMTRR